MHSKRVGAINLYKATANFAVYNLQNEAKENSPHSASLDVTVRTDTERCKFEDKRSKKMGEYLKSKYEQFDEMNEMKIKSKLADFLQLYDFDVESLRKFLDLLAEIGRECPGSIYFDDLNDLFAKKEDK